MQASQTEIADTIARVLLNSRDGKQRGNEIAFRCIFPDRHENGDATPGASWNTAKHVWLCRVCGAKGGWKNLAEALGIELPKRRGRKAEQRKIIAAYDYRDELGALLFQVVRFEPKDFRQRRPDGNGGWVWNLNGVRRVLYRLPELLAAPADAFVFIVEGERDVDTLYTHAHADVETALKIAVTCNPCGAGKWLPEYNESLRHRHVVVIPDADARGRKHADDVIRHLVPVAASVRRLELPA